MSRTIRRNRKPSPGKHSLTSSGRPYVFRPIPATCADGKQVRFPSKEDGDWRRISVRRWKAQCKAAIQRGDDPPPNPRTQGWLTW